MKKQGKHTDPAPAESPSKNKGIGIDEIVATLSSLKGLSEDAAKELGYKPDAVNREVLACEAATDILTALQDEGIKDPEQVRDLIHDYNALAEQYQKLRQRYNEPSKVVRTGNASICPECHQKITILYHSYCSICGKRLSWGR